MDIQSILASRGYQGLAQAAKPDPQGATSQVLQKANDFQSLLHETETQATQAMTSDADPHTLVQALAQSELAVETVVTVRDKVVEAYQEILRMPV